MRGWGRVEAFPTCKKVCSSDGEPGLAIETYLGRVRVDGATDQLILIALFLFGLYTRTAMLHCPDRRQTHFCPTCPAAAAKGEGPNGLSGNKTEFLWRRYALHLQQFSRSPTGGEDSRDDDPDKPCSGPSIHARSPHPILTGCTNHCPRCPQRKEHMNGIRSIDRCADWWPRFHIISFTRTVFHRRYSSMIDFPVHLLKAIPYIVRAD